MLHGWIILDKPLGLGSTQAVGAVKRLLREAGEPKTKVGHGGTLDPLASGVLPVALGEATKLAGRMLDATKTYEFTIRFGEGTDTLDMEGQVIATSDVRPTAAQVEAVLPRFTGEIEQIPPADSALKIEGKAAYKRARAGEQLEYEHRRTVIIHELRPLNSDRPVAVDPLRDRLQGHLHPQPRARHRPPLKHGRSRHHVEEDPRRPVQRSNRPFRWTFWSEAAKARQLTRAVASA